MGVALGLAVLLLLILVLAALLCWRRCHPQKDHRYIGGMSWAALPCGLPPVGAREALLRPLQAAWLAFRPGPSW